jgi:hypothetical protein
MVKVMKMENRRAKNFPSVRLHHKRAWLHRLTLHIDQRISQVPKGKAVEKTGCDKKGASQQKTLSLIRNLSIMMTY